MPELEILFTDNYTLSSQDIINGYVTLSRSPLDPDNVALNIVNGTPQVPTIDYFVVGKQVRWDNYPLENILEEGDQLRIIYSTDNGLNMFSAHPSRDNAYVRSTINTEALLLLTYPDGYFEETYQLSRVDVTYIHEDTREKKTLVHVGSDLHSFVAWTSFARTGTWKKMQVRVRDTDGATKIINRDQIGVLQDLILS